MHWCPTRLLRAVRGVNSPLHQICDSMSARPLGLEYHTTRVLEILELAPNTLRQHLNRSRVSSFGNEANVIAFKPVSARCVFKPHEQLLWLSRLLSPAAPERLHHPPLHSRALVAVDCHDPERINRIADANLIAAVLRRGCLGRVLLWGELQRRREIYVGAACRR